MSGTAEDRRAAATIATSLSGYVIAGALALIGAEAAIFVYLIDKKIIGAGLWIPLVLGLAVLLISCYLGARGTWKIYADGANGTWNTTAGGLFGLQTVLAFIGILFLVWISISAIHAPEKPSDIKPPENTQTCPPPPPPQPAHVDPTVSPPAPSPHPPRKHHRKRRRQAASTPAKT